MAFRIHEVDQYLNIWALSGKNDLNIEVDEHYNIFIDVC